ncbi:uncharacterized protein STEHIDRAFT_133508 [Stereum hirsutum FP-91666 SS1]|uniref:uncharacterized protein n=1 Tax=Stereum hirsutum (strain FP-91666) TaxID=721885 RepID=UPI0004449939|nr:uncharacterized protein STEHIDRAFT_133508 [Stereum hirsutum FP-91666 SS1]EIM83631.1 hypothetical protein STEHIDRAFT_133508 [Stereum hirsutum FP-91666 SS1]
MPSYTVPPHKRQRRTATSVFAGKFDLRFHRVSIDRAVEKAEGRKVERWREKESECERERERNHERKQAQAVPQSELKPTSLAAKPSLFWSARPAIRMYTPQRSVSISSQPMQLSSPHTSPGPSISSHTYHEREDDRLSCRTQKSTAPPPSKRAKSRIAAKRGWKGYAEGFLSPSEKNIDAVYVLPERRTRSGKSFSAATGRPAVLNSTAARQDRS